MTLCISYEKKLEYSHKVLTKERTLKQVMSNFLMVLYHADIGLDELVFEVFIIIEGN